MELFINTDGILSFIIQVEDENIYGIELTESFEFNPERPYMITLQWTNNGQNQRMLFNGIAQGTNTIINPEFPIYDEPISTFNRNKLFLETIDDLREKLASTNKYSILKASELIRQLIFDTYGPLVDRIISDTSFADNLNFVHGIITDTDVSTSFNPDIRFIGSAINPDRIIAHGIPVVSSSKEDFLNSSIIEINGEYISVKNILEFVLYKLGGTHQTDVGNTDRDRRQKTQLIEKFQGDTMYELSNIIGLVQPIGQVILKALEDLIEHVKNIE